MKKKIIIGVLLAVFLMLMLPVNSAVESDVVENNQNIRSTGSKDIILNRLLKRASLSLLKIKDSNPNAFNKLSKILDKFSNGNLDNGNCDDLKDTLALLAGLTIVSFGLLFIFTFPMMLLILYQAALLDCEWFDTPSY